jgi:hypothetical protein
MPGLAEAVHAAVGQPASVRVGLVEQVSPTLVVTAQGVPFQDVGTIDAYLPQVGDVALLLGQCSEAGSDPASWAALGALSSDYQLLQAGSVNISFVTLTSFTVAVNFAQPFPSTPSVSTNINSGAGSTAGWGSRAFGVTPLGFTMFVFGPSATWTNVNVQWQAQVQTQ